MKAKQSGYIKIVCLLLIILLNLGTLLLVAPLRENLSYLGNELGHKVYLFLWGSSAAIYFFYFTFKLMKNNLYLNRFGKSLLILACIGMIISVVLPYEPTNFPELSKWHTRIAMWSTILYVTIFFHFLYDLMKKNYTLFMRFMPYYSMVVCFCALFFILNDVSTILEISFTIAMSFILYLMDRHSYAC